MLWLLAAASEDKDHRVGEFGDALLQKKVRHDRVDCSTTIFNLPLKQVLPLTSSIKLVVLPRLSIYHRNKRYHSRAASHSLQVQLLRCFVSLLAAA